MEIKRKTVLVNKQTYNYLRFKSTFFTDAGLAVVILSFCLKVQCGYIIKNETDSINCMDKALLGKDFSIVLGDNPP